MSTTAVILFGVVLSALPEQPPSSTLDIFVVAPATGSTAAAAAAGDGSRELPFSTVFAARDAMRSGLGQGRPRTVHVSGDHHLAQTFVLDERDSASASAPVTYTSADKTALARLSGGKKVPVSAFVAATVPSGAAGVLKAELFSAAIGLNASDIPGLTSPYPFGDLELYYEGKPQTRSRSPNIAPDGTWMWSGYGNVTNISAGDMGFEFLDTEKAEMWAAAAAAGTLWMHGFFRFDWRDTFIKIDSIKPSGNKGYLVTRDATTPPCYGFVPGCRFYAVGALELLDAPGEYHVDKDTGTLHFLPPTPLGADSDVLVSVLTTVLEANNVNHTSWKDMTISVARGKVVQVTGGHNIQVANCTVTNAGSTCLSMDAGTNHTAHGNTVFGCGGAGISINSGNVTTLTRGDSAATGNTITNFSLIQRTYAAGIAFAGVGNLFANNTITHAPHTAITGGGNDNLFEHNIIRHACFETIE
jgi:hypothetical protein